MVFLIDSQYCQYNPVNRQDRNLIRELSAIDVLPAERAGGGFLWCVSEVF